MTGGHRKHVDHCLNCGAATLGDYCAACGQEAIDAAVTFRDQVAHFFEEVFGVESRLPQTVRLLLTRPGELTRDYNRGRRVRFVTPLKLYLFASVAFFLVLSLSAGKQNAHFVFSHTAHTDGFYLSLSPSPPAGLTWATPEQFDDWMKSPANAKRVPAFLEPHVLALLKSPDGFVGALVDMFSKASMTLVPIHALLLKLLYWRPRRLYGEHLVFSLHIHAFGYIAYAAALLVGTFARGAPAIGAGLLAALGGAAYAVAAARTAYGEGVARSLFKMTVAGVGYALALVAVVSLASMVTFLAA